MGGKMNVGAAERGMNVPGIVRAGQSAKKSRNRIATEFGPTPVTVNVTAFAGTSGPVTSCPMTSVSFVLPLHSVGLAENPSLEALAPGPLPDAPPTLHESGQ